MSRILCVAVVLAASLVTGAVPAVAGMSEGVAAVTVGDYEKAISEFTPLANAGDPAAQYQLARIYLEGRGPADGVSQGIALMNKAANGGYPEAQAQLGLMYAMGLGVEVDNAKAYDWLSKAVTALPQGTRRTVAEANRDAVLKRMNASQQTQVAAVTKTQEAPKQPAAEAASTKATMPAPAATTKTVTEAAATSKPATTTTNAATTNAAATTASKPAASETKTPEKATQVASAKAPEAAASPADSSAAEKAVQSGVRIQLVSMPSEDAAWAAWKQLSGKYSGQLSGLTAIVEPADLGTKGMFYRVQTGPFQTVAAAQERCSAMKEAGLDCLVVGKP